MVLLSSSKTLNTIIASLHPGVNGYLCLISRLCGLQFSCTLPRELRQFQNDLWSWWVGVLKAHWAPVWKMYMALRSEVRGQMSDVRCQMSEISCLGIQLNLLPAFVHGSFHRVGARFVTLSIVTSVNAPSIILDYKCTFIVVLQIRIKSISLPSIGNYNDVN